MLRKGLIFILILGLLAFPIKYANADQATSLYFPETGHWVSGQFLTFYQNNPNPKLLYGLPITEAFVDPVQNITIQYFQKARFELHPEAPSGEQVQLSSLGSLVYQSNKVQEVNMPTNTPQCRAFGTFSVCYAFLAFFDANGGLAQFGNPISNYSKEGDQYVQYFEKARFEFHPELSQDSWVKLTDIGRIQFDQSHRDPALLTAVRNEGNIPSQITQIQLKAYVDQAVVKANSQEGITVIAYDQYYRPVSGVQISGSIPNPGSGAETFTFPPTDASGITKIEGISVGNFTADQIVQISIDATYTGLSAGTTTWFQVWW